MRQKNGRETIQRCIVSLPFRLERSIVYSAVSSLWRRCCVVYLPFCLQRCIVDSAVSSLWRWRCIVSLPFRLQRSIVYSVLLSTVLYHLSGDGAVSSICRFVHSAVSSTARYRISVVSSTARYHLQPSILSLETALCRLSAVLLSLKRRELKTIDV